MLVIIVQRKISVQKPYVSCEQKTTDYFKRLDFFPSILNYFIYFLTENLWRLFFNFILFCLRRILESIHSKYKSLRWFVVLRIMGYHYRLILNDTKLPLTLEKHFEFFEPRQQKRFEKRDRCTTSILFVASYWILKTLTRTLGRQKFSLIFVTVKKNLKMKCLKRIFGANSFNAN
jgi:hypothetical protein